MLRSSFLVAMLLAGCGAEKDAGSTDPLGRDSGVSNTDGGGINVDNDGGFNVDGTADTIAADDCAEELKQIFVVTDDNQLHRFAPATKTFTKIGDLSCPADLFSTPFSMGVDRKGTAWVLFNNGKLYKVSTKDASCTGTSFAVGQAGFTTFGMSFARDGLGETLFVADYDAKGLGKIDTTSLKLSFIGPYGSGGGAGELTGRGDQLFAFFNGSPARVASIDKATGAVLTSKNLSGVTIGSGWAFAQWGGTFWLFHAPSGSSRVTEYDFEKGTTTLAVADTGFVIVGAGVSTCAPTERPK
jgi:hypothetical protein